MKREMSLIEAVIRKGYEQSKNDDPPHCPLCWAAVTPEMARAIRTILEASEEVKNGGK